MNINIKGYNLKLYKYTFNVYDSLNYKKPFLISINAPMIESAIEINKIFIPDNNKSYTYYLTIENDSNEYELNLNYSLYQKAIGATLSICKDNFVNSVAHKRLKSIKRFTLKQAHKVFNEFNLKNQLGHDLLNELYNHHKNQEAA